MERFYSKLAIILLVAAVGALLVFCFVRDDSTQKEFAVENENEGKNIISSENFVNTVSAVRIENETYDELYADTIQPSVLKRWKYLGKIKQSDVDFISSENINFSSNYEPVGANIYRITDNYVAITGGKSKPKITIYEKTVVLPTEEEKKKYKFLSFVEADRDVYQLVREETYDEKKTKQWKFLSEILETDPTPTICGFKNRDHILFSASDEPVGAKVYRIDENYIAIVDGVSKPKIGIYESLILR